MFHVVICTEEYQAPVKAYNPVVFEKGEVYQAEKHGDEYRVWRNKTSFLRFSPVRFSRYFRIFC